MTSVCWITSYFNISSILCIVNVTFIVIFNQTELHLNIDGVVSNGGDHNNISYYSRITTIEFTVVHDGKRELNETAKHYDNWPVMKFVDGNDNILVKQSRNVDIIYLNTSAHTCQYDLFNYTTSCY